MNLVQVVYVGRKPFAVDNVAHSGKQWAGQGDVQAVTAAQARVLVKYLDQWQLASEADAAAVQASAVVEHAAPNGETTKLSLADLQKPLEKMSKAELMATAQTMGQELAPALSKKAMIDQIEAWKNDGVGGIE